MRWMKSGWQQIVDGEELCVSFDSIIYSVWKAGEREREKVIK